MTDEPRRRAPGHHVHPAPPIPVRIQLPGMVPCPGCGLHYIAEGQPVRTTRCADARAFRDTR